jgi:DNA polymerase/3'-5' exonuclease PolX
MKKPKFPLADAQRVADALVAVLGFGCHRLMIVGSVRRAKKSVSDIELLYIPRFEDLPDPGDLFGTKIPTNMADQILSKLIAGGMLGARPDKHGLPRWGPFNKHGVHLPTGIPIDLFSATAETWACQLVCRTGSSKSNIAIALAAQGKELKWQPYGVGFEHRHTGEQRITCTTEAEVFEAVGLTCKEPHER